VFLLNIETGQREGGNQRPSPPILPDGQRIVMSCQKGPVTRTWTCGQADAPPDAGSAIDTGPAARTAAISLNRPRQPQLYVMGTEVGARRISFAEGRYSTPVCLLVAT
jgi:hypothetical protein